MSPMADQKDTPPPDRQTRGGQPRSFSPVLPLMTYRKWLRVRIIMWAVAVSFVAAVAHAWSNWHQMGWPMKIGLSLFIPLFICTWSELKQLFESYGGYKRRWELENSDPPSGSAEAQLVDKINELLRLEWDPVGVKDAGAPSDEYLEYAREVRRLKRKGCQPSQLADYLCESARTWMGVLPDRIAAEKVAEKIHSLV